MTSRAADGMGLRFEGMFGRGVEWGLQGGPSAVVWELPAHHLLWSESVSERDARRLWEARKGNRGYAVVLVAPAGGGADASTVRVIGPQEPEPVRELPAGRALSLLEASRGLSAREAASFLSREFSRIEESVVPGVRVKDLLTPHFLRERLGVGDSRGRLSEEAGRLGGADAGEWRSLFRGLGYELEALPGRGHLLKVGGAPVAVVHPYGDPGQFSRVTEREEFPEGMALADCEKKGAHWAILWAPNRYRLFQRRPEVGPATGQYLEVDAAELDEGSRMYLGLFAPEMLKEDGWLTVWAREARDFGEKLRRGLEERLRSVALPSIAKGLGAFCESRGDSLDKGRLEDIEKAALTLVFRLMFLLHTEARGYLPVGSAAYRKHSARELADDARAAVSAAPSLGSTLLWDRLRTLARMVRAGNSAAGVPAYNGSLFARDGFPGSELLEEASIADVYLAPAIEAIAFDKPESSGRKGRRGRARGSEGDGAGSAGLAGLDYAGLQVGHLGAIYEALLGLRLTRASEDLVYDGRGKNDFYRPVRAGDQLSPAAPVVRRAELYYQTEAGGRKAGGVFYTRHEFVDHLLENSLAPALDAHLEGTEGTEGIRGLARKDPGAAARQLFDFSVVDPAMGSAHFLTAALAMMADRIERFLAEIGGLPGIAEQLSELRVKSPGGGDAGQEPEDGDLLRRLILKRCIYGVDVEPMAVEIANVTLWLASFVPGLALSYLGSNLRCGDALIGVADASVVGASDSPLFTGEWVRGAMKRAAELQEEQASIPDRTPEEVQRSRELEALRNEATAGLRDAFNLWAAEPLGLRGARHVLETEGEAIVQKGGARSAEAEAAIGEASGVAERYGFFHWPLEFPSIFHRERPGFDVVAGNPPWNKVTIEEHAFYALRDPGLRGLLNVGDRLQRIAELDKQNPGWREEFDDQRERLAVRRGFFSGRGGYRLQGAGDTDLHQLFCERYGHLTREGGRLGVVLPRTVFLDEGAKGFRQWLFGETSVETVDTLLNTGRWAFDMESRYTIALLTSQRKTPTDESAFHFAGPLVNFDEFYEVVNGGGVRIKASTLGSSRIVPLVRSQSHADVLAKLRRGVQFDALEISEGANFGVAQQ